MANRRINGWRLLAATLRLLAATLMLASASLVIWGVVAYLSQPKAAEVRLLAIPGDKNRLEMPPARMQRQIVALMRQGKTPKFATLSMPKLKAACLNKQVEWVLLGCVGSAVDTMRHGAPVLIWDGLRGSDRTNVLVHEYAHALYGWQH